MNKKIWKKLVLCPVYKDYHTYQRCNFFCNSLPKKLKGGTKGGVTLKLYTKLNIFCTGIFMKTENCEGKMSCPWVSMIITLPLAEETEVK